MGSVLFQSDFTGTEKCLETFCEPGGEVSRWSTSQRPQYILGGALEMPSNPEEGQNHQNLLLQPPSGKTACTQASPQAPLPGLHLFLGQAGRGGQGLRGYRRPWSIQRKGCFFR